MSIYTKRHYEDVARILAYHDARCRPVTPASSGADSHRPMMAVAKDFADLFAADNPAYCTRCGQPESTPLYCRAFDGIHNFEGGFNRQQFLEDCGLESK